VKAPQLPPAAVVTRPGHPLQGQELRVLGWMRRHGALELLLELADGSKRLIPAAWTSLPGEDAGTGQPAAATLGQTGDLLAACALVTALRADEGGRREQAARKPPAREDSRAACPAQSAAGPGSGASSDDFPASPPRHRPGGRAAGRPDRARGADVQPPASHGRQ
jgi:Family of unknown function (DUF5372)